ncbi:hypothetical protein ACFXK0_10685 [Nocardia sp. NPDC059177]|uniref:hypothetical protein n=1 Tax=Nocardia sp. NPDC059177 TaxID=3346759 RepID=UPI0036BCAC6A
MVEFIFSVRDEPPEDGYSLGDLHLIGNAGSVNTWDATYPDQRMMVYPSAADLLSEIRLLVERRKGETTFEGIGSMFTVTFSLQKRMVETWYKRTKIDTAPLAEFLNAAVGSAKNLLDHGAIAVRENRTVLDSLRGKIEFYEAWQQSIENSQRIGSQKGKRDRE